MDLDVLEKANQELEEGEVDVWNRENLLLDGLNSVLHRHLGCSLDGNEWVVDLERDDGLWELADEYPKHGSNVVRVFGGKVDLLIIRDEGCSHKSQPMCVRMGEKWFVQKEG